MYSSRLDDSKVSEEVILIGLGSLLIIFWKYQFRAQIINILGTIVQSTRKRGITLLPVSTELGQLRTLSSLGKFFKNLNCVKMQCTQCYHLNYICHKFDCAPNQLFQSCIFHFFTDSQNFHCSLDQLTGFMGHPNWCKIQRKIPVYN